jgi:hypothetical protein
MKDLIKDNNRDLLIQNNDLVIGFSDQQHREDLILIEKGAIKQFPNVGVGAFKFLESEDAEGLLREISLQFSGDGMNVKSIELDNSGKIIIDAPYK